ncbi:MAG: iron ABC transporter permease, partial [Actinomycetota bacterium]|nr:iron ABC transporter permease [Actinomycetota bacterium]
FIGAIGASAIVYLMARSRGGLVPLRLILTGVVLAYGFQAIMSLIVFMEPRGDAARTVMFWMLGSFGGAHWGALPIAAGAVAVICCYLYRNARRLDVMALGDATAAGMGVDCVSLRRQLFLLTAIATGALVAVSGAVGFVGLVIPHIVRLVVGPVHRRVLILAPLVGAIFLVWVDLVSRVLMPPRELPLGIVTAIV